MKEHSLLQIKNLLKTIHPLLVKSLFQLVSKLGSWYFGKTTTRELMESSGFSILPECPPLNKPPSFNGQHYTFWKQKMRDIIEAPNIDMWELIENRYNPPSGIKNGISMLKSRNEWIE